VKKWREEESKGNPTNQKNQRPLSILTFNDLDSTQNCIALYFHTNLKKLPGRWTLFTISDPDEQN